MVSTNHHDPLMLFRDPRGESGAVGGVNWLPVDPDHPTRYLGIETGACQMKEQYCNQRAQFWRTLGKDAPLANS